MHRVAAAVLLLLGAAAGSKCPSDVQPECTKLDAARYAGLWYEQTNSKAFVIDNNLHCVTANYTINADGTVKVDNRGRKGGPTGEASQAVGTATPDKDGSCKLGVKFASLQPAAPYDIIATDYDNYAIVTSCIPVLNALDLSDVWILARKPQLPKEQLQSLLAKLKGMGFNYGDMRMTDQSASCVY